MQNLNKYRLLILYLALLLLGGCKGRHTAMAQSKIDNLQTYSDGRYDYQLPAGGRIYDDKVNMDQIKISIEALDGGRSLAAQMQSLHSRLLAYPDSPIITSYHWSDDSGGYLYLGNTSIPDYYEIEGRRILASSVLVAIAGSDKSDIPHRQQEVYETLARFHPSESAFGKRGVFAMHGGYTTQPYHGQEDLFSSWINPDYDLSFDISSQVFLQPQKLDLIERSSRVSSVFSEIGGHSKVLRKDTRMLNGMMGQEYISADTDEHGVLRYSARLQVPGEAISPLKPQVEITLQTGMLDTNLPPPSHKLTQEQFLALWDALVTSFKARDLN